MKKPAQETRQHILDVAKALMTQKGYTAVGLAEVVAANAHDDAHRTT